MSKDSDDLAPYRGEFRFVFYAPRELYEKTVAFYRDILRFPVVGGFSHGTYLRASTGVIEVISDVGGSELRSMVAQAESPYTPAQGAWLLIEVEDLDSLYEATLRSQADVLHEPRDWPWLFRDFKVKDPCGNVVCLFRRLRGWEKFH